VPVSRHQLWIVVVTLAGCNQIFGLNDPVTFVDASRPADAGVPVFGDCIVDPFDTLDPAVWTRIVPNVGLQVAATGGELALEGAATTAGEDGVISRSFDLTGGSVEVKLTDSVTQADVSASLTIAADDGDGVFTISRNKDLLIVSIQRPGVSSGTSGAITAPFWRVLHDEPADRLRFEFSSDGSTYVQLHETIAPGVSSMKVSLSAQFSIASAEDRVAFDDAKVTALCPP
jgi:hypothetical protein